MCPENKEYHKGVALQITIHIHLLVVYMFTYLLYIQPPPTTPASGQDFKDKNHRFAVQNGKTREQSQEYMAFKQHYCLSWGR